MIRLLAVPAMATIVLLCAALSRGEGSGGPVVGTGAESAGHCITYSTGSDAHTSCAPPASAPQGSAIACRSYTVGSDAHAECALVPAPRLSAPGGQRLAPVMPMAAPLRCQAYHIGTSTYTECR